MAVVCEQCGAPAIHGDSYGGRIRLWCETHTPWSGHYEDCPHWCNAVMARAKEDDMNITKAVGWVWQKLSRRGGMATKQELDAIWDHDPALLDDALWAMRKAGIVSYLEPNWYIL